jgi:dihydropteroate synthase
MLREPRRVPLIMGIVNVTPDSFYAASRAGDCRAAVDMALRQIEAGADIVDIGGQSTRPGSAPVPEAEELRRVLPVFAELARRVRVPLSVDTDKARVARECLAAGAAVLNDVSALRSDPGMLEAAQAAQAVVLMHRGGKSPKTMQNGPHYKDVVWEVRDFLSERREAFRAAGGETARLLYDPGIGFGKNLEHNIALIRNIAEFSDLGPVLLGVSRKSFLGQLFPDAGPGDRMEGSLAAACWAAWRGVKVLRVHDVPATKKALAVMGAILGDS